MRESEPAGEEERGTYRVSRSPVPERKRMCEVPLAELGLLSGYEPLLEPLVDYLLRSSSERRTEALSGTGLCALRVGAEQEKIGLTAKEVTRYKVEVTSAGEQPAVWYVYIRYNDLE